MSLCAPFLAFDPVMQFVVGATFFPLVCSIFDFPDLIKEVTCGEKRNLPVHHILSVVSIGRLMSSCMHKSYCLTYIPILLLFSFGCLFVGASCKKSIRCRRKEEGRQKGAQILEFPQCVLISSRFCHRTRNLKSNTTAPSPTGLGLFSATV